MELWRTGFSQRDTTAPPKKGNTTPPNIKDDRSAHKTIKTLQIPYCITNKASISATATRKAAQSTWNKERRAKWQRWGISTLVALVRLRSIRTRTQSEKRTSQHHALVPGLTQPRHRRVRRAAEQVFFSSSLSLSLSFASPPVRPAGRVGAKPRSRTHLKAAPDRGRPVPFRSPVRSHRPHLPLHRTRKQNKSAAVRMSAL